MASLYNCHHNKFYATNCSDFKWKLTVKLKLNFQMLVYTFRVSKILIGWAYPDKSNFDIFIREAAMFYGLYKQLEVRSSNNSYLTFLLSSYTSCQNGSLMFLLKLKQLSAYWVHGVHYDLGSQLHQPNLLGKVLHAAFPNFRTLQNLVLCTLWTESAINWHCQLHSCW